MPQDVRFGIAAADVPPELADKLADAVEQASDLRTSRAGRTAVFVLRFMSAQ